MLNDNLETLCQHFYRKFQKLKINIPLTSLQQLAKKEASKAKENYTKLSDPKTCSLSTYTTLWVREALENKFTLKTLRKIDWEKVGQDLYAQALASLSCHLPRELIPYLRKEIFNAPFPKRQKIWQSFKLPIKEIESKFQNFIEAQEEELSTRNHSPFFDVFLKKNKIPQKDYSQFIKNVDRLIAYLNHRLPQTKNPPSWFYSEFNLPCFVCQLPSFPFHSLKEVFDFVAKEYPILKKFQKKIKIKIAGDSNSTSYRKKGDFFQITIEKGVNIRHQTLSLTHELGHVIDSLNNFAQNIDLLFKKGRYGSEQGAIKIEMSLIRKISPEFFRAILGEILLFPIRNTLFEIDLHQNPKQNLGRLYAQTFNRCFLKARQKNNPLYILDTEIVSRPFALLPHAIAWYKILQNFI